MQNLPFRTQATWLSDNDLILLDALFDRPASIRFLRRKAFHAQYNLGYLHRYNDDELRLRLLYLSEQGILRPESWNNRTLFHMTAEGGSLWSQERCPVWDRFCTERYQETSSGRTLMTVIAISPTIRDDFLRIWPPTDARRRVATVSDYGLVPWHPFPILYVGLATYVEQRRWTWEEYTAFAEILREHRARLQRERSWWRFVPELQRFTTTGA
jgi:hypothetical protein